MLDSMNGHLLQDMNVVLATFNGFMRGLEFNGKYCYIGQSQQRHVTRLRDRPNTSIDCGIHILDLDSHVSRFEQLNDLQDIYQIALWQ
jgi:hypothetical protein